MTEGKITAKDFKKAFPIVLKRYINYKTEDVRKRGYKYDRMEFSKRAGMSYAALHYFLTGVNAPKAYMFLNIIKELDVDIVAFIEEIEKELRRV